MIALIGGLIVLDLGVQGQHILNQTIIYALRPEARSRLTTAYMGGNFVAGAVASAADRVGMESRWLVGGLWFWGHARLHRGGRMDDRVRLGQGDRIAGYEIEAVIARGGMGVVYRAHQVGLGRSVALKVIAADRAEDPSFRARFVREARLAASLDHPNVIPVFEAGDDGGELFIAMRLVDGCDLDRLIDRVGSARSGDRPAGSSRRRPPGWMPPTGRGSSIATSSRPNILLAGPLDDPHVYVSDFGVAKSVDPAARLTDGRPSGSGRPATPRPSRSAAARSTPAPTSTRSAASCSPR